MSENEMVQRAFSFTFFQKNGIMLSVSKQILPQKSRNVDPLLVICVIFSFFICFCCFKAHTSYKAEKIGSIFVRIGF